MNDRDLSNLKFLLYASDEALKDWILQADEDDVLYATELVQEHLKHFKGMDNDPTDFTEAKAVLSKFRLN